MFEAEQNSFKAEPLLCVTNVAQEERQRRPESERGANTSLDFDNRGQPTLKVKKSDFYVPLPTDEPSLRNRFEVLAACLCMLKMRFSSHPAWATVEMSFFVDYVNWLCGEYVWGFVVKGQGDLPISCPHLGQVLAYELAVRELAVKLMKGKMDWKSAMEAAMADPVQLRPRLLVGQRTARRRTGEEVLLNGRRLIVGRGFRASKRQPEDPDPVILPGQAGVAGDGFGHRLSRRLRGFCWRRSSHGTDFCTDEPFEANTTAVTCSALDVRARFEPAGSEQAWTELSAGCTQFGIPWGFHTCVNFARPREFRQARHPENSGVSDLFFSTELTAPDPQGCSDCGTLLGQGDEDHRQERQHP